MTELLRNTIVVGVAIFAIIATGAVDAIREWINHS